LKKYNDSLDNKIYDDVQIINDEYVGGEIEFPYIGVKYTPKAGDLLMFPSNYIASHQVHECKDGNRYAYIGYYSQGSIHKERGIDITKENIPVGNQGQIWMPEIVEQYINFVKEKYKGKSQELLAKLLQPTSRSYNSADTQKELLNDK
jgi:hypothetical protein